MKIMDFLKHYGLNANPFAEEDAQNDSVFKESCIKSTRHPCWDKLYGNPAEAATSLVFGEKGSGKTALRLQMIRELTLYNSDHRTNRPMVVDYSDLNPFLDSFRNRMPRRWKPAKILGRFQLRDHLDAILSLAVTQFVDRSLSSTRSSHPAAVDTDTLDLSKLTLPQIRDLLSLAIVYDNSRGESPLLRFENLAKKTRFFNWTSWFKSIREFALGIGGTTVFLALFIHFDLWHWFYWFIALTFVVWVPWLLKAACRYWKTRSIRCSVHVLRQEKGNIFAALMKFPASEYSAICFPRGNNQESRYELLERFLALANTVGFNGLLVLMDRVDEPYLVNGSPELMKSVVWPLMDNRLLKHENLGFKMLLPKELYHCIEKEDPAFMQRSRTDKQNLIPSLAWTGESLLELANARINACAGEDAHVSVLDFFDQAIDRRRIMDAFAQLRVPRHLFKFLYRLLVDHAGSCTSENPDWKISVAQFESTLATYIRDRDAADRGIGIA